MLSVMFTNIDLSIASGQNSNTRIVAYTRFNQSKVTCVRFTQMSEPIGLLADAERYKYGHISWFWQQTFDSIFEE